MALSGSAIAVILLSILGVVCICIGAGLIPYFNQKIKTTIEESVKLKRNSDAFKAWLNPPATIYLDFHFFNVTNSIDVVQKNSKPIVQQIGPYVYREIRDKTNHTFIKDDTSLLYYENKTYIFDVEKSLGRKENDSFYSLNIPILTIAEWCDLNAGLDLWKKIVSQFLDLFGEHLFERRSVKEFLWGYNLTIIDKWNALLKTFNITGPKLPQFGIYTGDSGNGTADGLYEISTGLSRVEDLGVVETFDGSRNVSFWSGDTCNMINGTDGSFWHPFVERTDKLYIFDIDDVCRSLYATYQGDSTVSSSKIPVYQFSPPKSVMQNSTKNQDNACFCTPAGNCMDDGVLNISICKGAPIIMSQPHFFQAAPKYLEAIDGLQPNEALHKTIIDVEPHTGLVLNAAKKIQLNVFLRKLDSFKDTENLTEYVFPIFWANEHGSIPDAEAAKFRQTLLVPIMIASGIQYGLIALGAFLIVCVILVVLVQAIRKNRQGDLHVQSDERTPLLTDS
jgi:lysosome membrane protein 2